MNERLEPLLEPGKAWYVAVVKGSRKKGTLKSVPVSAPIYTLEQARCFCNNNRVSDFINYGGEQ